MPGPIRKRLGKASTARQAGRVSHTMNKPCSVLCSAGRVLFQIFCREVVTMPNEENLIPMDQRSKSEASELGKKGGIASGAARRRKRSLKEAADLYLSLPVTDRRRANKLLRRQVDPEDIDNQMAMIAGLTDAATDGDARAAAVLVKLLGEETPPGDADAGEVRIVDDL